ncbi:hypothetical protein [Rhizobium sp. LC145]|uniref:hypothetical protein n=1 Tax=Rhizobium sp. LC145 TaxID=1120688 RepID=UPI000629FAE6|nr:hypothetical protein [Rhizobium sp. LC145]KKX25718.1 hypothetical protein YH62_25175 [Rhizobium sp. LC145]TKT58012.1 hypothetical protein FDR95_12625 [Rhizobiaceae bacterium LC148]
MAIFLRQLLVFGLTAVLLLPHHAALAADPCKGVDTNLSAQRKADYSKLVAKSLRQNVKPSKISVMKFMQAGTWTVVYADVPVADPGYFFFDSSSGLPVFKDVWGGVADKSEEPEITKWATALGANKMIASCFADMVIG